MEKFTHKGWLGICPVYLANIESEEIAMQERHIFFAPLMWFSTTFYQFLNGILPDEFQVGFPIKITGELK